MLWEMGKYYSYTIFKNKYTRLLSRRRFLGGEMRARWRWGSNDTPRAGGA